MKILLATDGSKYSETAAKKCCELVRFDNDTKIKIISVAEYVKPIATEPFAFSNDYYLKISKELTEEAQEKIDNAKKIVEQELDGKVEVETHLIEGYPKQAIVEEASNWGADLIVLGSHGYGFWNRMLIGSVSNAVVHHAPCSVLVVRTDEEESN